MALPMCVGLIQSTDGLNRTKYRGGERVSSLTDCLSSLMPWFSEFSDLAFPGLQLADGTSAGHGTSLPS